MIDLPMVVRDPHHHTKLNISCRSDLEWWATFLPQWNGVGMLGDYIQLPLRPTVTSDASVHWGCGAFSDKVVVSTSLVRGMGRGPCHSKGAVASGVGLCHMGSSSKKGESPVPHSRGSCEYYQ